jgi:predicted nuclease with TOPRIM domain
MSEQLEQRLQELKSEFETGQKMLAELEAKQANLRETLLRISGAIQVLQELLADTGVVQRNDQEEQDVRSAVSTK